MNCTFQGGKGKMAEWELGGDEGARDISYKGNGGGREDSVT